MALTLSDAADFIAEQARELAGLLLAYMATPDNIKSLQKQATQNWQQSQSGWKSYHRGYSSRKSKWLSSTENGVLTGAWRDYRTMERGELRYHQKGGNIYLQFAAVKPTSKQKKSAAWHIVGKETIAQKPWVEYPQRQCIEMPDNAITPMAAAILPACKGDTIQKLLSQLPLHGINWRPLTRNGVPLARVGGRQVVVLKSAWKKALR